MIGQLAVIHHLQQDVVDIRMRLLDLVEQQHAMRVLVDAIGQQAALIEPDIARGRADQPRDGMLFHVFRHVEAQKLDPSVSDNCRATSVLPTPVGPANR